MHKVARTGTTTPTSNTALTTTRKRGRTEGNNIGRRYVTSGTLFRRWPSPSSSDSPPAALPLPSSFRSLHQRQTTGGIERAAASRRDECCGSRCPPVRVHACTRQTSRIISLREDMQRRERESHGPRPEPLTCIDTQTMRHMQGARAPSTHGLSTTSHVPPARSQLVPMPMPGGRKRTQRQRRGRRSQ